MDIKVVELKPMKVASSHYIGENPEINAIKRLIKWAQSKNALNKNKKYHFFGFNNPNPSKDNPVYGYEVWMPLDDDVEGDDKIRIKEYKGGLFAVIEMTFSDFIANNGWNTFHSAESWMKENMYEYDSTVQWLEELIVTKKGIDNFMKNNDYSEWLIGLYMPIKKLNER